MATLIQKIRAEQKMRELLDSNEVPGPDRVEYGWGCIRLFWNEIKTVLVIDIDKPLGRWDHVHEDDDGTPEEVLEGWEAPDEALDEPLEGWEAPDEALEGWEALGGDERLS